MAYKDTPQGIKLTKFAYSRKRENRVRRPEMKIVAVIVRLAGFYKKRSAFPGQEKILTLLKRWYGIVMSRRTLNRHLNALCRDLLISRTRRHQYHRRKGLLIRSTLYKLLERDWTRAQMELKARIRIVAAPVLPLSNGRVPQLAQYISSFIKILSTAPTYPQFAHTPARK